MALNFFFFLELYPDITPHLFSVLNLRHPVGLFSWVILIVILSFAPIPLKPMPQTGQKIQGRI